MPQRHARSASPLAGEADPAKRGETGRVRGLSPRSVEPERTPHPNPLPVKDAERERGVASLLSYLF
jgi:hypothetical protein